MERPGRPGDEYLTAWELQLALSDPPEVAWALQVRHLPVYRRSFALLFTTWVHHKSKLHRKGLGIHFDWRNFSCTGKAKKNLDAPLQIEASKKYFTTGVEACSHIYYTSTRQQQYVGGMRLSHFCGMTLFDIHNCLLAWNIIVIPNFAVTDSSLLSCLCFRIKASVHRQNSWKGKLTWALRPHTNSCTAGCGSDLWLSKNSTKSTLFALGSGISSKF